MTHVDGNAIAGVLAEVFRDEMTTAEGTCAGCGDHAVLAAAMVYTDAAGFVLRCGSCESVLMTIVTAPGDTRVSMRGLGMLKVPR